MIGTEATQTHKNHVSAPPGEPTAESTATHPDAKEEHKVIVLLHGFPELWWSWKYQIESLTHAGYRVIAVDLRGFGGSDCPESPTSYDVFTGAQEVLRLLQRQNISKFSLMGHGIGSEIAHFIALYTPNYVESIISLNYLYKTPAKSMTFAMREMAAGSTFDFFLSHIDSVVEVEYEKRMETLFRRLFAHGAVSCGTPTVLSTQRSAGSTIIDRLGEPCCMPHFFDSEDMQYYLENYRRTGFSGSINYFRNKDTNIERFTSLRSHVVSQPALVVLGEHDILFDGSTNNPSTEGYRNSSLTCLEEGGPFLQLQKKDEVDSLVLPFLKKHASPIGPIE